MTMFIFQLRILTESMKSHSCNTTYSILKHLRKHVHPYLSYLDSPEPAFLSTGHHVLVNFLLTSSKTHVANLLTHHIAAEGR